MTLVDVFLSFKNPPGYVENKIVIIIKNIINAALPYTEKLEKLLKILVKFVLLLSFDNVKSTMTYNKAKTDKIIVSIIEDPNKFVIYPPGSAL
jgi:hypothetical protein